MPGGKIDPAKARDLAELSRDSLIAPLVTLAGVLPPPTRSPAWRAVREAFLKSYPKCQACGQADNLNVHHILPFHLFPSLELQTSNLITLCERGPAGVNCHLMFGHGGDWKDYNPNVLLTCHHVLTAITNRRKG